MESWGWCPSLFLQGCVTGFIQPSYTIFGDLLHNQLVQQINS
jgi:hypothetical protein